MTEQEAIARLKKYEPAARPEKIVAYGDLYLILAPRDNDPYEGYLDAFYSVNTNTGETRDYGILRDGKGREIGELFEQAPSL